MVAEPVTTYFKDFEDSCSSMCCLQNHTAHMGPETWKIPQGKQHKVTCCPRQDHMDCLKVDIGYHEALSTFGYLGTGPFPIRTWLSEKFFGCLGVVRSGFVGPLQRLIQVTTRL